MQLFDHQQKAIQNIQADIDSGYNRLLCAMATGTGKTHTGLAWLAQRYATNPGGRMLWIAHRQELIEQPFDRATEAFKGMLPTPGIVKARHNEVASQFVIASIQTLYHRLPDLLKYGAFTEIVYDEVHHARGKKNEETIRQALHDRCVFLGLTATPKRHDGLGLDALIQKVSYRLSLLQAINLGILAPLVAKGVVLPDVDFSSVRSVAGDYSEKAMSDILNASNWLEVVYDTWRTESGHGKPTLAFTVDVESAHVLAQHFKDREIIAAALDGKTPTQERAQIIRDYRAGRINVLCNCMVLTEGFDAPETRIGLMVRPTQSDSLYIQMVGRILRRAEGKDHALILDFAPAAGREGMVLAGDLLEGQPKEQRQIQAKAKDEDVIMDIFGFRSKQLGLDVPPDSVELYILNYMVSVSRLAWLTDGNLSVATIGNNHTLAIVAPQPQLCQVMQAEIPIWNPQWNYIGRDYVLYEIKGQQVIRLALKLVINCAKMSLARFCCSSIVITCNNN